MVVAAIVSAPGPAGAESTLYGRVNQGLVYTDYDDPPPDSEEAGVDEQWDVKDNSSRIGIKGSEEVGNGIRAVFQIELQIETADGGATSRPPDSFGTRLGYAGLAGDFGAVSVGRQWTPYYDSVHKTDLWQIVKMDNWYLGEYRQGNMITYASPDLGGLSGKLAAITDGESRRDESGVDWYNASMDFNSGPLSIGLSYMKYRGDESYYQAGIAAKYVIDGRFGLIAQYETLDDMRIDGVDLDLSAYAVLGEYYFGNNTLRVGYGNVDDRNDIDASFDTWTLGFQHNFSKRTRIFAEYQDTDNEQGKPSEWAEWYNNGGPDRGRRKFGLGLRHDF